MKIIHVVLLSIALLWSVAADAIPTRTQRVASTSAENFGTGTYTSAAFTPSNNSLLTIVGFAIEETDTGLEGTSLTVANSAGLTCTSAAATTASPTWSYGIRVWTCPVTTGASMTVSLDAGAFNVHAYRLVVFDYTNYDTTTPVGAIIVGTDADGDGTATMTLPSAPATTSEVLAAALSGIQAGSGSMTPAAGWTEVSDATTTDWAIYQAQIRSGSTSTSVDWTDVVATGTPFGGANMLAVEIRELPAGDTTPNAFSFTDQTNVALSTLITSVSVTITGIDTSITCNATTGNIDLNGAGIFASSQSVSNNDTIRAQHTSSASNSTAVNTPVDCNGVSDTFTSTTVAASGGSGILLKHRRRR